MAFLFGASVVGLTGLLAWELWRNSALARQRVRALASSSRRPGTRWPASSARLAFVYGTLMTSAIALLIAVPLGIGVAIFLAELAPPRLSAAAGMLLELLAAVPSVIYGLIGIAVLVPLMREWVQPGLKALVPGFPLFSGPAYGIGLLTAGLVLAIMIVPFIVSVGREVLLSVPREQREAALALGATRWESTWKVVLPYARPGLYGAIFLALGRALGETMAVTMVIGNRPEIAASLFAPAYSMAAVIANEFSEADRGALPPLADRGRPRAVPADHGRQRRRARAHRGHDRERERAMSGLARNRRRRIVNVVDAGHDGGLHAAQHLGAVLRARVPGRQGRPVAEPRVLHRTCRSRWARPGGGMANALVGSAKMLGIAALTGLPLGLLAGPLPERVRRPAPWRTPCATRPTC